MYKYSVLITVLLILIFLQGCSGPSFLGFDGPPSNEEILKAQWRGFLEGQPDDPQEFIRKWNEGNWRYDEEFKVIHNYDILNSNPEGKINKEMFILLFNTAGDVTATNTGFSVNEAGNVVYKGVEIELLETGKVKIIE